MKSIKQLIAKLGYRDWVLTGMHVTPTTTKYVYECRVTGRTKVELDIYGWDRENKW